MTSNAKKIYHTDRVGNVFLRARLLFYLTVFLHMACHVTVNIQYVIELKHVTSMAFESLTLKFQMVDTGLDLTLALEESRYSGSVTTDVKQ